MDVFVHSWLFPALGSGFISVSDDGVSPVGAGLGNGVEMCAVRAREAIWDAAVANDAGIVINSGTTLNEARRTRRVDEQCTGIVDALVIARIQPVI